MRRLSRGAKFVFTCRMPDKRELMKRSLQSISRSLNISVAAKITIIYAVISALWVLLSDQLVFSMVSDPADRRVIEIYKGWFFVLATAGLLYFLIRRYLSRIQSVENKLRENQRFLSTLMNNLPGMVYRCRNDQDWTMEYISDGCLRLTGYEPGEFFEKRELSWNQIIREDYREIAWNKVQMAFQEKQSFDIEYPIIDAHGDEKWVWELGSGIYSDTGAFIAIEGFITDISDRIQAEAQSKLQQQQLMQADKMTSLGILVSGVAHEINNPNNFMLLNSNILADVWKDILPILQAYHDSQDEFMIAGMPFDQAYERIAKLITGITEGSLRIEKIVESLKNFAREDKGDLNEQVNVNSVIESALIIVHNLVKHSTNHFSVTYAENLPVIRGNFQQLEQVVINLISNACQALSSSDQSIDVATACDPESQRIIISIQDQGSGISQENGAHVFDPFFTTRREIGGTGLGLSISHNVIKDHQGSIRFQSEPGLGTTMIVELPVAENEVSDLIIT